MMARLFWLYLFAFWLVPCQAQEQDRQESAPSSTFNSADPNRVILIGFADHHIDRVHTGAPTSFYRRRGEYKSSSWSRRINSEISGDYSLQYLADWPMTEVGLHCVVYQAPESTNIDRLLQALEADERIDIAQRMHTFATKVDQYDDPYYQLQSGMTRSRISEVHRKLTGRNVKIGLIDTGVDINHPDLIGQIWEKKNFATVFSPSFSDDVHGTAVAGIIAAQPDNGVGIVGLAPDSTMLALKACWPNKQGAMEAVCNTFTLALAINSAIRSQVDIINLSLTGPDDPILTILINKAVENGIIVVVADGRKSDKDTGFPASLDNVIAVRTIGTTGDRNLPTGRSVEAPGKDVLTTLPHGAYDFVSGSSLSTAYISALVALLRQRDPDISALAAHQLLQQRSSLDICAFLCGGDKSDSGNPPNDSGVASM